MRVAQEITLHNTVGRYSYSTVLSRNEIGLYCQLHSEYVNDVNIFLSFPCTLCIMQL